MNRRELIGMVVASGITGLATAQEKPEEKSRRKAIWDEEVITLALTDILTDPKSHLEVAIRGPRKGVREVLFELAPPPYRPGLLDVFQEKEAGGWERLSETQWDAARLAGRHMQRRASDKKPVESFTPKDKRLIRTTTKLPKGQKWTAEWQIRQVFQPFPPGYSPDGSFAVVFLRFTWAGGYHGADATYLFERQTDKWRVLAHDSRIYP